MSDASGWQPVHHEEAEESTSESAPKPRDTKPKEPTAVPLVLMMAIPPELIAALSSLSGTMERIASEVAAQGKAIQAFAEAMKQRAVDIPENSTQS